MNSKQIKQAVKQVVESDPVEIDYDPSDFLTDLFKLQRKYPECYVEAWTPSDFQNTTKHQLTKHNCQLVAEKLYDTMDANYGTNWDRIKYTIKDIIQEYV